MKKFSRVKTALMAAASLSAVSVTSIAHAAVDPTPSNPIEYAAIDANAASEIAAAPSQPEKIALAAIAAGLLASIIKLVGAKRVLKAARDVGPAAVKAAAYAARAPLVAAKSLGASIASPLKFGLAMGGLGLFAFTGIGFFDLEWIAGLFVGALLVAMAWYGGSAAKRRLRFAGARTGSGGDN